jgi:hypothetical protein
MAATAHDLHAMRTAAVHEQNVIERIYAPDERNV